MKIKKRFTESFITLVILALLLGGCSGFSQYTVPNDGPIPKGMSLVFGDFQTSPINSNWIVTVTGKVNVVNLRNGAKILQHSVEDSGGPFYWCLPPGKYSVIDFVVDRGILGSGNTSFSSERLNSEFTVSHEQEIIYVGSLDLSLPNHLVSDNFDIAVKSFKQKYPKYDGVPIIKQLFQTGVMR